MTVGLDRPDANEVEVSIFGPGVGECVVVHLGGDEWMVVDSCKHTASSTPVALEYLAALGVDPARVRALVLTHWHVDHIRGAAEVLAAAANAVLVISGALRLSEFKQLILAGRQPNGGTGTDEINRALAVLQARARGGRRESISPMWASEGRVLMTTSGAEVRSLSPSDGTISLAHHELAALLPREGPKLRVVTQGPNRLSVVLWVQFPERAVLLGGDLEVTKDPRTGWTAAIAAPRPTERATVFKVPHHGSGNAHSDGVWREALDADPIALCAPYSPSGLPRADDIVRLRGLTTRGHLTGRAEGRKPRRREAMGIIRGAVRDLRELEGPMGHVRVRFPLRGSAEPTVDLFGAARQL